ncbi:MAG: NUDIX hydrolase [Lachnospiraceae bacterium]
MAEENQVKRLERELKYKGRILDFYEDTMQFPNGSTAKWDFLHHNGAAAVVPVDTDGNIYMVSQYRSGVERMSLEIPAGCLNPGEDRKTAAARELEEEIGYRCENIELLLKFYSAFAYCDEYIEIYVATGLVPGKQHLDEDEFLAVQKYPIETLVEKIFSGEISDSKTIAAILAYKEKYGNRK